MPEPDDREQAIHDHQDLRSFIEVLKNDHPREYLRIDDALSGHWELAACTTGLAKKLRVPLIEYTAVKQAGFPVVHNVCSSLARIARVMKCSVSELEARMSTAYDSLIPPHVVDEGPVHDVVLDGDEVDLGLLPEVLYTETQEKPYLSAACVVARDPVSGETNVSFHRLMIADHRSLAIYMTAGADLHRIFSENCSRGLDTPVVAFIGSHPLWSLGSLAAGPLSLDEFSVIGGLMGCPLEVVRGRCNPDLILPARAEISLEGHISRKALVTEGPYGEAFGFVSNPEERPLFVVESMTHREQAIFQDIVPSQIEHMTMTSVAIKVHLEKTLTERYDCVQSVFLPAPMTVYIGVSDGADGHRLEEVLREILHEQRYVKLAVLFDGSVKIDNASQTQRAISLHVQAHRDLIVVPNCRGNGLDPSEYNGETTKWGINATATSVNAGETTLNALPAHVLENMDVDGIFARAMASQPAKR